MNDIERWTTEKSKTLYGIENWGGDYFDVNDEGHITVSPDGPDGAKVDLFDLVQAARDRDIKLPVLFRFNGILRHRVRTIYKAFQDAIREDNYQGSYIPAYPIKVNQQRHIVDVIRKAGGEFSMGLEVGSKPELIAVLAIHDDPSGLLLCNGYKDREYMELALMSKKVGRRPLIIIEKMSELALVLDVGKELGVEPDIGFRLRLSEKGSGRWEHSGGDKAKFGLNIGEVVQCVDELRRREALNSVKLIHYHIGSQLTAISSLRSGLKEATQVYVQLKKSCPELVHLDVGGGLGVDYDGSKTNFSSSMNYTVEEYARDIIWIVDEICTAAKVPHPNIITESGRALSAYHSVLVFDVLGAANTFNGSCDPEAIIEKAEHPKVKTLASLFLELTANNSQETLHDAMAVRQDILAQFRLGLISIEDRALSDGCYWALLTAIAKASRGLRYLPEDLENLPTLLTDTYFCNLSIFQSLPDHWAIDQVFPVAPVHRLDEEPTRNVVLGDITCDSDGKIDRFPDLRDVKRYLQAHELQDGEPYYFASFLVGAYQEILGDLHNLFGDTNAVHVEVDKNEKAEFSNVIFGDTIREVLKFVQYDKKDLCERWRSSVEAAVSRGDLSPSESAKVYGRYAGAFDSYTYLDANVENNRVHEKGD